MRAVADLRFFSTSTSFIRLMSYISLIFIDANMVNYFHFLVIFGTKTHFFNNNYTKLSDLTVIYC